MKPIGSSLPRLCGVGLLGAVLLAPGTGRPAESGAPANAVPASDAEVLLHLFERKGLITPQEAGQAREELARRAAATPVEPPKESKVKIANWVQSLGFYGDARLRYEYRGGKDLTGDDLERHRWRYRLRIGANLELTDHFQAGVRLESGPRGRSTNVTFADDGGPWDKGSDGIHLGLLYLTWQPAAWFSATGGRQPNPFTTSSLVWDGDLTPEGLSQTFQHTVGDFALFARFGQFLYDDANPDNPLGTIGRSDAFLFGQQLGARYHFNPNLSAQIAPVLYVYSGGGDTFDSTFVGWTTADSVGVNDLLVLEIPVELRWQAGRVPLRIFADYAVNLEGADRARRAGYPEHTDQIHAWQAGLELGSARKKGGWSLRGFWQYAGLFALDPNLVDSDLFDSRLNMQGPAVQGTYAFTDFLTLSVTYAYADQANRDLPTVRGGDLAGANPLRHYQIWQADLSFKF